MRTFRIIAIALLTTASGAFAQNSSTSQKEPTTGKSCVTYMSSEYTQTGLMQVNFHNICGQSFEITVQLPESRTKSKAIEAGTVKSPARASITCKQEDHCDTAKWQYE